MTHKFPGTDSAGTSDTSLEDMGLWEQREAIAKRLYRSAQRRLTPGTLWPWDALNERTRGPWRKKAKAEMAVPAGVKGTDHQTFCKDTQP